METYTNISLISGSDKGSGSVGLGYGCGSGKNVTIRIRKTADVAFTWASINPEYPPPKEHGNPVHPSVAQLHICIHYIHLCMGRVQINIPKIPPVAGLTQTGRCTLKKQRSES
jgi:hypothetical protein